MKSKNNSPLYIWTVGHSTRSIEAFIELLKKYNITRLIDIRTIPRSRHNPQYNQDTLPTNLQQSGIEYEYLPKLGGLRHSTGNSINTGWHNSSFRAFADYMLTEKFLEGVNQLLVLAAEKKSAIMCAETVPWRCHRSLVSDALTVRGVKVEHIISLKSCYQHILTPWSKVDGTEITYPAPSEEHAGARTNKDESI